MEHRFELFADYFQFYLQDDDIRYGDLSNAWDEAAVEKMLALGPHTIGVGTVRNMTVPVTVVIVETMPDVAGSGFQRVNRCDINIATGCLVIAGCTDNWLECPRIELEPGVYDALVGYKGLDTLSDDGLEGNDSYHVFLWPTRD